MTGSAALPLIRPLCGVHFLPREKGERPLSPCGRRWREVPDEGGRR